MAVNPNTAAKLHHLDGLTSYLEAMADPLQKIKLDAFSSWDPGYEPPRVDIVDDIADGPHGPIPVRIYRPARTVDHSSTAALVWFHGGGFIGGDLDAHEADTVSRELAVGRCTTHQFR